MSTGKPVSPKTGRPSSSRYVRGNDLLPFAQLVINPRPATTSLPRRDALNSSRFWGYLAAAALSHAAGRLQALRRAGRRTALGNRQAPLDQGTYAFLAHWARKLSWQETAEAFRTTWDKVCQAVEYLVTWGLEHRDLGPIRAIGVDEIQYAKGHKYLTLVYQIEQDCTRLLWIGKDRTIENFEQFFTLIGKALSRRIEFVCSDMWKPYLRVIREKCPNALNILDRFHIVAKMNDALDDVRAAEARRMAQDGYEPVLKKSRWCVLKRKANLTGTQTLPAARSAALQSADGARLPAEGRLPAILGLHSPPGPPSSSTTGASKSCARASSR